MSESTVNNIREKIDDFLDEGEKLFAEQLKRVPAILRGGAEIAVNGAFGLLRGVLGIPDDIGGDAD